MPHRVLIQIVEHISMVAFVLLPSVWAWVVVLAWMVAVVAVAAAAAAVVVVLEMFATPGSTTVSPPCLTFVQLLTWSVVSPTFH